MGDRPLGGLPLCETQRTIALRHRNGATQTSENHPSTRLGELRLVSFILCYEGPMPGVVQTSPE
jgi:hypothetical protein